MSCQHEHITLTTSKHGKQFYAQPKHDEDAARFPAPLVLPGDDIEEETDPHSLKEFLESERHVPDKKRRTIYLVDQTTEFQPLMSRLRDYVEAFFGLPVKILPGNKLVSANTGRGKAKGKSLEMHFNNDQVLDIAVRPSADDQCGDQLSLNDLIDVLIYSLPKDAFATMMITDYDLYEDKDDVFCCGRAYGLDRVAVVSTARYKNALFDEHAWPASHCQKITGGVRRRQTGALRDAVDAFSQAAGSTTQTDLWLSRICKTATHELGHCFGIDHCCYFACLMQGSANLDEDARQPPYLCPIDEAKVISSTGDKQQRERLLVLLSKPVWSREPMFAAFKAWLEAK